MIKYNRLAYSYCVKHTVGIIRLNKKAPAPSGRFVDIVQDDHSSQFEFHSVTRRRARRAVVARAAALLGVEVLLGKQELLVVHPLLVLVLVLVLV